MACHRIVSLLENDTGIVVRATPDIVSSTAFNNLVLASGRVSRIVGGGRGQRGPAQATCIDVERGGRAPLHEMARRLDHLPFEPAASRLPPASHREVTRRWASAPQ